MSHSFSSGFRFVYPDPSPSEFSSLCDSWETGLPSGPPTPRRWYGGPGLGALWSTTWLLAVRSSFPGGCAR